MKAITDYVSKHGRWKEALTQMHETILDSELECSIKWGAPVYSYQGKNVVGLGAFKNHFGVWFFQGVFLKDKHELLHNAQEGKTKAMRQLKFTSVEALDLKILKAYVDEAIQNQKEGKGVKVERNKSFTLPIELQNTFNADRILKQAFDKLSFSKQREYCEYISDAKRDTTKESRIQKIKPMIEAGIGLNDKYKNC